MSNPLHLISEETFQEESSKHLDKLDNIVLVLHSIAAGQGGNISVTTWKQIQQVVRMGLARKVFSVGDKFIVSKESNVTIACSNTNVQATINAHQFIIAQGEAGNIDYEATFDGIEWHDGDKNIVLANYGISITSGTPEEGDKLVVHETASDIEFVILGFDQETPVDNSKEHSLTLGMVYTFDGIQFDGREAFFTNRTGSALAAGNYNFLLKEHSWRASDVNKYFQFTLTSALPIGGQLVFQQAADATLEGASVKVFASGSTKDSSPTETVTLTEGRTGTYLGELKNSLDLSSAENYQKCFNHCQRAFYGNNRWSQSAIRQWCNADGAKGTFWQPKNDFDRQPSWHDTSSGKDSFLYNLDPELVSVLGKCVKFNELANCDRSDGVTSENTEDLAWLHDRFEIQSCSAAEATSHPPYEWWHLLLGSTYGDWRTDTRFIKTNKAGSAQYWWLRSPYTGNASNARYVLTSGSVNGGDATFGNQAVVVFAII